MMSTRDNRLPMFIILKNPWCHKSSVSKFLFGTLGHLQLLVTKTLRLWEMMLAGTGKAYQNQVTCRARLQRRANTPNLSVSREPYTCNTFPAFHSSSSLFAAGFQGLHATLLPLWVGALRDDPKNGCEGDYSNRYTQYNKVFFTSIINTFQVLGSPQLNKK